MENEEIENNLIHNLETPKKDSLPLVSWSSFITSILMLVLVGSVVGFLATKLPFFKGEPANKNKSTENKKIIKTVGMVDKKTFKDNAEGILKEGGIDGEGSFHLERSGGESQNVYLTSSTVDLSDYTNKKVRVWGQTFQGQKAGWLMDVGLVEILQ